MEKRTIQKKSLRFLLIVGGVTIFTLLLHLSVDDPMLHIKGWPQGAVLQAGLFKPVALVSLLLANAIGGLILMKVQGAIRGNSLRQGLAYGATVGGVWMFGMLETFPMFGNSLYLEFLVGCVSAIGITLMSVLIARFVSDGFDNALPRKSTSFLPCLLIPVLYVAGRYLSYSVLGIHSGFETRPHATGLWTVGFGLWIGIAYALLGMERKRSGSASTTVAFGGLVFGINWLVMNAFFLLFLDYPIWDIVCRVGVDVLAVCIGAYLCSRVQGASASQPSSSTGT